jgi:hypothetical protein
VTLLSELEYSTSGGAPSSVPILFVPAIAVPANGAVEFPLAPISMWLAAYSPSSDFDVVIEARCDPDGAWARYAITSGGGTLGSAGPSAPPDRSPSPAPLASLSWSACLRCVGAPA